MEASLFPSDAFRSDFDQDTFLLPETKALYDPSSTLSTPWTAILMRGVFGTEAWHFAVHMERGEVIEFVASEGVRTCDLEQSLVRSHVKQRRGGALHPSCRRGGKMELRVYALQRWEEGVGTPSRIPFPTTLLSEQARAEWAKAHLKREHYHILHSNCEHVARFVLTNQPVSTQAAKVLTHRTLGRLPARVWETTSMVMARRGVYALLLLACLLFCVTTSRVERRRIVVVGRRRGRGW